MVRRKLLFVGVISIAALCARAAAAEILIGVAGPMTGKDAWFGEQWSAARRWPWPTSTPRAACSASR